jgi:hypothetical protein
MPKRRKQNRSKLAKELRLKELPRFLIGPRTASSTVALRYPFLMDQVASGRLPTIVMVPGFFRIHTDALEDWYEGLSSQELVLNKNSRWSIQLRVQFLKFSACLWIEEYAHAVTTHAINAGYIIRKPCVVCEKPKGEAHHPSYDTPLQVIFLCKRCHSFHHRAAEKLRLKAEGHQQMALQQD